MTETPQGSEKNKDPKGFLNAFGGLVGAARAQRDPYLSFALLMTLAVVFTVIGLAVFGRQIDPGAQRLIGACVGGGFLLAMTLLFIGRRRGTSDAHVQHAAPNMPTGQLQGRQSPEFRQIVLITPAVSNFFDLIVSSVSITAHREHLNVIVKVPNARFEAAAQNSLINAVCDNLVHGEVVVVVPAEPEAVKDDLSRLCSAHRTIPPLVALDIPLKPVSGGDITNMQFPYVGVDNTRGAELAADAFSAYFRDKGILKPAIYVLLGPSNISQWRIRADAFIARFTANTEGVCVIIESGAVSRWDRQIARDMTYRHLTSSGTVDGIFACNDDLAIGARQAVLQWRRADNVKPVRIIGFDGIDEMYDLLAQRDDIMLATVNVRIAEQVRSIMQLVTAKVEGRPQPFDQRLIPPTLVEWGTTERPQLTYDGEDAA